MDYKDIKFRIELRERKGKGTETLFVPLFNEKNGLMQYPVDLEQWDVVSINHWDAFDHNGRMIAVGDEYWAGKARAIHRIGDDYIIIEFHPYKTEGCSTTDEIDEMQIAFHTFVDDGKRVRHQYLYNSLDEALIGAIAEKYEGDEPQAFFYICKMLGIKSEEGE